MSARKLYRLSERPAPKRPRWIVDGLVAEGDLVAVVGAPGAGKSALVAHMAAIITRGGEFLGREVWGPADVVYIAAERVNLVARRLNAESADADRVIMIEGAPAPSDLLEMADEIQRLAPDPKLIVIDTLARCLVGLDENSSRDMGMAMRSIDQFRERFPTAATILVHHVTSATNAMRGSTALLGAVDSELVVSKERRGRRLEVRKANDGPDGIRLAFEIDGDEVGSVRQIRTEEVDRPGKAGPAGPSGTAAQILDMIPTGVTPRDEIFVIADGKNLLGHKKKRERLRQLLKGLEAQGMIRTDTANIYRDTPH